MTSSPGSPATGFPASSPTRRGAAASRCRSCWTRRRPPSRSGAHGLIALDWENGNRSVLVDAGLSGVIVGLTLATTAPEIYRALLEATAFGTRLIIETFRRRGRSGDRVGGRGRPDQERRGDADLRGRPPAPAQRDRVRAGAGARVCHSCRGRRGRLPGRARRGRAPWAGSTAASTGRTRPAPTSTTSCTPSTSGCTTTFGRGANEVMYRLRAIRDRALGGGSR